MMAQTEEKISQAEVSNQDDFYQYVLQHGKLRTLDHAQMWTRGTLNMLGVNLSRGAKKALANALPKELSEQLGRVFWLAHFRNTNLPRYEFQNRVARRSGNTDATFAYFPIMAVFGGLKGLINSNVSQTVYDSLAPELQEMWQNA